MDGEEGEKTDDDDKCSDDKNYAGDEKGEGDKNIIEVKNDHQRSDSLKYSFFNHPPQSHLSSVLQSNP